MDSRGKALEENQKFLNETVNKLETADEQCKMKDEKMDKITKEITSMKIELEGVKITISAKEQELEIKNEDMKNLSKEYEEKFAKAKEDNKAKDEEIDQLQRGVLGTKEQWNNKEVELKKQVGILKEEINRLNKKQNEKDEIAQKLEDDLKGVQYEQKISKGKEADMKATIDALTAAEQKSKQDGIKLGNDLKKKNSELGSIADDLKRIKHKELERWKAKVDDLNKAVSNLSKAENEVKERDKEIKSLQKELTNYKQGEATVKIVIENLNESVNKMEMENKENQGKIQNLSDQLEDFKQNEVEMKTKEEELQRAISISEAMCQEKDKNIQTLMDDLIHSRQKELTMENNIGELGKVVSNFMQNEEKDKVAWAKMEEQQIELEKVYQTLQGDLKNSRKNESELEINVNELNKLTQKLTTTITEKEHKENDLKAKTEAKTEAQKKQLDQAFDEIKQRDTDIKQVEKELATTKKKHEEVIGSAWFDCMLLFVCRR